MRLTQAARRREVCGSTQRSTWSRARISSFRTSSCSESGGGRTSMNIADAVLLGEIVSPGNRRKDIIDRPKQYAAAGVPFFMRVECATGCRPWRCTSSSRGSTSPVAAAAAGTRFVMREPFEFAIDPADLLDEEPLPERGRGAEAPSGRAAGVGEEWPREFPPRHRPARLHRLDRHPGHRHRAAQPRPVPGGRARRRRRQRRAARRAGARARRRGGRRWPRPRAAQDLQLAFYAEAQPARLRHRRLPHPEDPGRARRDDRAGRSGRATSCSTAWSARSGSRRRWPRCAPAVPSRWPTRSRWSPAARWSRPRCRGRARSCRSTPSTRRWPSACAAARAREVRRLVLTASGGAVPRPAPRRAGATSPPSEALAHPTWDMGPVVTINSATMVNKGARGDRGARAVRRRRTTDIEVDGAPAVGDPLDGRVRRRLDDRPGQPAGHAAADRARRWAGRTGCRTRPPAVDWTRGAHLGVRAAGRRRRSRRCGWPRRPAGPGGCRPAIYNAANEECVAAFVGGPAAVPGHRRHRRAGARRTRPTSANQVPSRTCSPRRRGRGPRPARSSRLRREGA